MVFFDFDPIAPPAPNDPLVDEAEQINANWDQLDAKLTPYTNLGVILNMETGQERIDTDGRLAVHTGSGLRKSDNVDDAWSDWTAIPLIAPYVARTSLAPYWRENSLLRKVELAGGILNAAAANPWPFSLATITTDATAGIPIAYLPFGGKHVSPCASALASAPQVVAGGYAIVDRSGANNFVRIRLQYLGGPGGGNFLQLEQIQWWY